MESEPKQGINKTSIILALIGGAQAIVLALIASGQIALGKPSAEAVAEVEQAATKPYLPLKITAGELTLKEESKLDSPACLQRIQAALEDVEFKPAVSREKVAIRMTRGPDTAMIWCEGDGITLAAAGPSTSDPDATLNLMQTRIEEALRNELPAEE